MNPRSRMMSTLVSKNAEHYLMRLMQYVTIMLGPRGRLEMTVSYESPYESAEV